jgi:hypothetical protein
MGAAGDPLKLKGSPYETLPCANKARLREPHPVDGPGALGNPSSNLASGASSASEGPTYPETEDEGK